MSRSQNYISALRSAYCTRGLSDKWESFVSAVHGITKDDKAKLKSAFPDIPDSLVQILEHVDGTYYRQYDVEEILFYFFGSDVSHGRYPYYLYSSDQMTKLKDFDYYHSFEDIFNHYKKYQGKGGIYVDERILTDGTPLKWLCFSDCMNNGGTSRLYIDFTPSPSGKKGQIVRYLHDPDELRVIADSFDEYLEMLINNDLAFVQQDH